MALLRLPKSTRSGQVEVPKESPVQKERRASVSRPKKAKQTDEELSLHIFELFSQYDCKLVTTREELVKFLALQDEFGIDTETSGLSFYSDLIAGFSLGTATQSIYVPLYHDVGQNYQGDFKELYDLLSKKKLDGFNWKFDKHFLTLVDARFDSLNAHNDGYLIARLLNNNLDAGLKPLYKKFIDPNVEDYSFSSLFSRPFIEYDPALVYPYAAVDAQKHFIIANRLEQELLKFPDLHRLYKKLELPLTEVVGRMERHGIRLDRDRIYSLNKELNQESEQILKEIKSYTDESFNPGSPKQVGEALVALNVLQLDSKGKVSTSEKVLESVAHLHPLPELILDYRGVNKLSSTYTIGLLDYADVGGIAHPIFNQMGTDTGRFSSTRFNAQNIPKDNRFRNLFLPQEGNLLVGVDYSQQEVRILAALAEDETMIEAFKSGKDFYAVMASLAFNLPYEECTKTGSHKELRGHMKSVVLGLNYDMGMKHLAEALGKSLDEAQDIYNRFQKTCPGVGAFKKKCKDFAYSHGYAETVLKRRRYFEGVGYKALGLPRFESSDPAVLQTLQNIANDRWAVRRLLEDAKKEGIYVKDREAIAFTEERQCTNSVIQGSAGDMTKLAMLSFDRDPIARKLTAHIVLQIHDEIIVECPKENAEQVGERLAFIMNGVGAELMNGLPAGGKPEIMERWAKD